MAITATDIIFRLSTTAGAAGDTTAQGDPNASLGKYMSTTAVGTALHDLFDVVTGDENAASDVEYRCIFVLNNHATLTWESVKLWLSAETAGGATLALAADGVGAVAKGSASAQADQVADESTAPSGETFSAPTTKATGISLGNIPAQQCHAIWVRRTANNTAAQDADGGTISVEGDTAA